MKEFLEIFPEEQYIDINNLFAHSSIKEYDEHDFPKKITIADIEKFKDENNSVLIDNINFSIDSIQIRISDECEYQITSVEPYFTIFVNKLFKVLTINDVIWSAVQENPEKYTLIDEGKIVSAFSSFDDFLQSEFANML